MGFTIVQLWVENVAQHIVGNSKLFYKNNLIKATFTVTLTLTLTQDCYLWLLHTVSVSVRRLCFVVYSYFKRRGVSAFWRRVRSPPWHCHCLIIREIGAQQHSIIWRISGFSGLWMSCFIAVGVCLEPLSCCLMKMGLFRLPSGFAWQQECKHLQC